MWSTAYYEPGHDRRVLANGPFDICIIKFVQCAMLIDDGTMLGRVELTFDGGIALRHPTASAKNPVAGMLSEPAPPVNNPLLMPLTPARGGFTRRTTPSKPSTARFKAQSRTHR